MAENYLVARIEKDDLRLSIYWDDNPENPRYDDNLGTMICFHRNYCLGDDEESKRYGEPRDFLESLAEQLLPDGVRYYYDEEEGDEVDKLEEMIMGELIDLVKTKNVILPLFIYDHSGVTMNTSGYSCPWDSGQVGWIYVSYSDIANEYGELNEETIKLATEVLEAEVKIYDYYLTGSIYGYVIDEKKTCSECGHITYDKLDSCWGFYGEYVKREMKENVAERFEFLFDLINWY